MNYSVEFQNKVKQQYGANNKELLKLMMYGDPALGKFLDESKIVGIPNEKILSAKSLDDLKAIAAFNKQGCDLYKEWSQMNK